ncbi:alpha/beta-hydrolase [Nadsonia fulvescens var. elongata DSM 6958]|uniref:Alpha/beta-hydrolase n=1 Tax=Nadsonia fulvescens var. elongata DSM 6958 TaxID=857566 RepID=A0A1E3PHT2_9ASCO|nr:alpha/beta-hydrolase [Nadsonia fulvescens var. elongata DSM 6958]
MSKDATSDSIPTVDLAYDIYEPSPTPQDSLFSTSSTAKGTSLHQSPGEKPPLVFIHGLFGNKSNSRAVSRILANDTTLMRDIYCLDLRNHGHSPHSSRHDYPAMARDIENFIEKNIGTEKGAILIGHSMGAKAAMAVSIRRPNLVKGMVSVDNAPVAHGVGSQFTSYLRAMAEIERKQVDTKRAAYDIFERIETNSAIVNFVMTNLVKETNPTTGKPVFKFRIPVDVLTKQISRVGEWPFEATTEMVYKSPTLFISGTRSDYINDRCLPAMKAFFPHYNLEKVEAGHWVISENMPDFITVLKEFIIRENI